MVAVCQPFVKRIYMMMMMMMNFCLPSSHQEQHS